MSKLQFKNNGNGNKYKIEVIWDNVVYAKKLKVEVYLPDFYYLILWKEYLKEENN